MKSSIAKYLLFILALILWNCGQKSNEHDHGQGHDHEHPEEVGPNQALYDEVMKVHDEVMPKMNDIYKMKQELLKKIVEAPDKKKEIEATIAKLDSASEGMMVWMRQFNPIPDSLGEEKAREYLEDEMEKVKKVKEDILEAMEEAKGDN